MKGHSLPHLKIPKVSFEGGASRLHGGLIAYLQLGRSHTYPADWLLCIVPFLAGGLDLFRFFVISVVMFFVHWVGFGENSLLDFTQGYDKSDPSKSHHPLSEGRLTVHQASNAIHWTKAFLVSIVAILTLQWAPNPLWAMISLLLWVVWGTAYNIGLDKENLFGFVPIVFCFVSMGAWGWFMSHDTMNLIGASYLLYAGAVIMFQIAWSGHLKDLAQKETSNLLVRLGAKTEPYTKGTESYEMFLPGKTMYLGVFMKAVGIVSLLWLAYTVLRPINFNDPYTISILTWVGLIVLGMVASLFLIVPQRLWLKPRELRNMSIMEIFSIFAPVPLMLPWVEAIPLLVFALAYFYFANKALWGVSYPKV